MSTHSVLLHLLFVIQVTGVFGDESRRQFPSET